MKDLLGKFGIAEFLRDTNPRVKNFYAPIESRLEVIRTLANSRGLKKISAAIEGLDYASLEKSTLSIRANDSVYLRIPFGKYKDKMTNFGMSHAFLWQVSEQVRGELEIVSVARLSDGRYKEYQKNILDRIHELANHIGRLYAT